MEERIKTINVCEVLDGTDIVILTYTVSRVYHVDEENVIFDASIFREIIEDYSVSEPYYVQYHLTFGDDNFIVDLFAPEKSAFRADYYAWVHYQ